MKARGAVDVWVHSVSRSALAAAVQRYVPAGKKARQPLEGEAVWVRNRPGCVWK